MKYLIIKSIFLFVILSTNCFAGVYVLGTRFFIDENTRRLNIKVVNDNESDYLIKTAIADNQNDDFVISPPLFVLLKNQSNIITIIPNNVKRTDSDRLYKLSIASIPKSNPNEGNSVALAVRSNFYIIYRHSNVENANFNQLTLVKNNENKFALKNDSKFVFRVSLSKSKTGEGIKETIAPKELLFIPSLCGKVANCNIWVSFLGDDDSIMKQINMSTY